MTLQDRTYFRGLDDTLLVEAGYESRVEIAIALAERLEDVLAAGDPSELLAQIREMEVEANYYRNRVVELEAAFNEIDEDY
jgi:hypothetical protein